MWRLAVILLLVFITIKIAHGEEPYINPIQEVVIKVNKTIYQLHDNLQKIRPLRVVEDIIPLDDFRFTLKPNVKKSIKKRELRWYMGVRWTF